MPSGRFGAAVAISLGVVVVGLAVVTAELRNRRGALPAAGSESEQVRAEPVNRFVPSTHRFWYSDLDGQDRRAKIGRRPGDGTLTG